jgi:hypothetical protein
MGKNSFFIATIFYMAILFPFRQLQGTEINKTYPKKESIALKVILSNCKLIKSTDDAVHIDVLYSYSQDTYHAVLSEFPDSLFLEEEFSDKSPEGSSSWTIAVPEYTRLYLSSATGNISAEGVHSEMKAETGTGSIDIKNSTGIFDLKSGTGNIHGAGICIIGNSRFMSGTGQVNITIASGSDHDITVASGTGDAILNYNGHPLKGHFELIAKHGIGRIVSAVDFEKEEIQSDDHFQYDRKSFKVNGRNTPRIRIETGNGQAKLIK